MAYTSRNYLDSQTAANNRELMSPARIEADMAQIAAMTGRADSEAMTSRLAGLIVCRRLLDGPERCRRQAESNPTAFSRAN
jgi:hypothetical protein